MRKRLNYLILLIPLTFFFACNNKIVTAKKTDQSSVEHTISQAETLKFNKCFDHAKDIAFKIAQVQAKNIWSSDEYITRLNSKRLLNTKFNSTSLKFRLTIIVRENGDMCITEIYGPILNLKDTKLFVSIMEEGTWKPGMQAGRPIIMQRSLDVKIKDGIFTEISISYGATL